MRVAIGGIAHESSTFATVPTTLDDFVPRGYSEGQQMLDIFTGTKSGMGGFIDAARALDFEVVPALTAWAEPAGPVTAEATQALTGRLTEMIRQAHAERPLDGILLGLHGAMVSELDDDGESYILRAVRDVVGPDLPIIVTLDLHGNITEEMVQLATICVAFDEYPHTDPYERGLEAGLLMARVVRGGVRPTAAIVKIPLLAGGQRQYSHAEPMIAVKHVAHDIEGEHGVLNVSYLPGFPWADIVPTGFSIIVTTDGNPAQARDAARRLARYIWTRRDDFVVRPVPVDDAVRQAMAAPQGPIVLADIGDNPGGGTPADGTVMLEALLRLGATRAVITPMNDPEVVQQAIAAGEGATIRTRLGGKIDAFHGAPLDVTARVVRLTDGKFVNMGVMNTGVGEDLGPTAVLEIAGQDGGSVQVITTTHRQQPTDLEMLRSQGIEPTEQQILVVKSSVHYRAAFTPIAKQIVEVDTPGLTSPHLDTLEFRNLQRPIYPLDGEMEWEPE
jgi:microcystin degradation protein MlrC